jgi:DNA-directed RNA polymerase beta subunit
LMSSQLSKDDLWDVFKSTLEDEGLVQHHLRSYNYFIKEGLQQLLQSFGDHEIKTKHGTVIVKFGKVEVGEPFKREVEAPTITETLPIRGPSKELNLRSPDIRLHEHIP